VGNASHPFKTFAAAWAALPKAPQWLTTGVIINLKPVSLPGFLVNVLPFTDVVYPEHGHRA
jgi:hypothetical protein